MSSAPCSQLRGGFCVLQCVAAVLWERCQEAATLLGIVSAELSLLGHAVSSAALATTPTPTATVSTEPAAPAALKNMPVIARLRCFSISNPCGLHCQFGRLDLGVMDHSKAWKTKQFLSVTLPHHNPAVTWCLSLCLLCVSF